MIVPTLVSIFAIVFVSAIRDISTIILLITARNRSLAVLMMEYSRGGQLEVASIIGVIIAVVAIAAAIVARRLGQLIRECNPRGSRCVIINVTQPLVVFHRLFWSCA